ncbi:MAG: dTDP-4-dehydrorhamnose 3,5-epimerase [Candidatus Latescibacterota bacterium]
MAPVRELPGVGGVLLVEPVAYGDDRGRFAEVFRKEWFPERTWDRVQWSRSESQAGVLRGLHYHHRQVDYWHCAQGRMRVGLADLRRSSPTRGHAQTLELTGEGLTGLYIPAGVAHGFYAVSRVVLFYLVDNYYDGTDENGVAWDDPEIGLDWGLPGAPIVSGRDRGNPPLAAVPPESLPR